MKPVYNPMQLNSILLKGYKSIKDQKVELGSLNVLIGGNGSGKSNFIGFFKMVRAIQDGNIDLYVGKQGGPDAILHFGRKSTERLEWMLYFGHDAYKYSLYPTQDNRMILKPDGGYLLSTAGNIPDGSEVLSVIDTLGFARRWCVYHFHDTSDSARVKQLGSVEDYDSLAPDARNLAAYLHFLEKKFPEHYLRIVKTVRLVAPFFGNFVLRPNLLNEDNIELVWTERGQDIPFKAHQLSDGTLRFICLATVFLQPPELQPETILVDEPELGLHPYAISILASLIRTVSETKQVILSTQSVELVNEFDAEDIIVTERRGEESLFTRPNPTELEEWLTDYSLGELWKKNLLGGRPTQ
jgi:predicted ATPase